MATRAALRKTSLIDFPGRVASVLFLAGCNLRCPYCHNAALVEPARGDASIGASPDDGTIGLGEALALIERRKGLVSGVVLSGGEPLVHEELPSVAAALKGMGLALKLDTNGTFPERIEALRPDYLAIDLKTAPSSYGRLGAAGLGGADLGDRLRESLKVARRLGCEYEFRITCAPGVLLESDLGELIGLLEPGDRVFLQDFRPGGCLDSSFDAVEPYGEAWIEALRGRIGAVAPLVRIRGR